MKSKKEESTIFLWEDFCFWMFIIIMMITMIMIISTFFGGDVFFFWGDDFGNVFFCIFVD